MNAILAEIQRVFIVNSCLIHDRLIISSVNRYERKKGLSVAFDALALVRNEFPDVKIHFIHGGGYDPQVMAGAMHNWQRALCASQEEPEWEVRFSHRQI